MCNLKNMHLLRISNRGSGVREEVINTTYTVNIPSELRGKSVNMEFIKGNIVLDVDKTSFVNHKEVGIISDLGIKGSDVENQYGTNNFMSTGFNTLYHVDLSKFNTTTNKTEVDFESNYSYKTYIGSLPERLTFSTYTVDEFELSNLSDAVTSNQYKILTVGSTNFTLLGASSNTVGEVFTYNGATPSGSGTMKQVSTKKLFNNNQYLSFILQFEILED